MVELLGEQTEDAPAFREYDQAVVALIAASTAVADLAELVVQGGEAGEVEFGDVVQAQSNARLFEEEFGGAARVGTQDLGVSDGFGVHEIVATTQGVGVLELVGESATGMPADAVGEVNKGLVTVRITEVGSSEVFDAEGREVVAGWWHGSTGVGGRNRTRPNGRPAVREENPAAH